MPPPCQGCVGGSIGVDVEAFGLKRMDGWVILLSRGDVLEMVPAAGRDLEVGTSGYEPDATGLRGAVAWGRITPELGVHALPSRLVSSGEAPVVPVPLEVALEASPEG